MRIALVISTLRAGGSERVMSIMANHWASRDTEVSIITLSSKTSDCYGLHPSVRRVGLDLLSTPAHIGQALRSNIQRMNRLRHELRSSRPDVVISFGDATNVLMLIASLGLGIRVIISERTDPRHCPIGSAWAGLRSLLYRRANAVVVQSYAVRDWASRLVEAKALHVIPNPVKPVLNGSEFPSIRQGSARTVVAMGRLGKEKRFDLLLRAFERCTRKHSDWSLIVLGEGQERRPLEALAGNLGITDRVRFSGQVSEPAVVLRRADLFVLSSRYEGFPNALLEAMACGLAVIATDCPSGPREIIREGVDGVLVPPNDLDALASSMDRLMEDQAERQRLGANAVEVIERFGVQKIMNMWDDLLVQQVEATTRS
jgi:GalNAc-alpha-(1->4)-GalNAc-alpha-(1->3)-diNAcBac-PP-undecaprenol alpha-1,4-N-acetyl-D-galactosaminyltransferase